MDDASSVNLPLTMSTPHTDPDPRGGPGGAGVQFYPSPAPGTNQVEWLYREKNGATKGKEEEGDKREDWQSERIYWGNKWEYILSTLGYSVGLGNLFRFPYLCNRNGGGAFLIPFMLSLLLMGMPLFALEVALGQFSGRNAQQVWAICPLFKGAGMGMVIVSSVCFYYYNTLMAWGFYYMVSAFRSQLPWGVCDGWWNTPSCFTYTDLRGAAALAHRNGSSAINESFVATNYTVTSQAGNITGTGSNSSVTKLVSSTEEFFQHNVLQLSGGFGETGSVVWYLAVTLAVSFIVIFFALFKGIRSSGKVVYVTATAPYLLVTALLIRGATLPGAIDGVIFYLKPDFSKLAEPQVWVEAALQVFYSLGPCWGGLVVMASFNKFRNNCLRDAVLITLASELTSIYGGFAIFSVLGYMAHVSGKAIDKVVSSGPGLAFIAYPEAISLMPLPQLWAVFFFFMVITLAIDTQMTTAEVTLTTIIDLHPRLLSRHRSLVTAVFCAVLYVLSLPFVTQGGVYLFQLADWFVAALSLIAIGLVECLVVGWIYGVSRIGDDMYMMLGRRPPFILCVFWKYITPSILLALLVTTFINYTPPTYGTYVYGLGGKVFGWCVALVSFLPIPAFAVYYLWRAQGSLGQRLRQTLKPDYTVWKPADDQVSPMYGKERQLHV